MAGTSKIGPQTSQHGAPNTTKSAPNRPQIGPKSTPKLTQIGPKSTPGGVPNRSKIALEVESRFWTIFGAKMRPSWEGNRMKMEPHMEDCENAKTLKYLKIGLTYGFLYGFIVGTVIGPFGAVNGL